ncbi:unnamed protein product [Leptidea sinapis]|uniref:Ig-like domain-containing protein n=1 Tax=Leptidea sinapis TaxID=189913 RepID=A0A5E4R9C4_9NEOP|nr:unnamed protein product [Leptidea sinapis]
MKRGQLFIIIYFAFHNEVTGLKAAHKEVHTISVEPLDYGADKGYLPVGTRKTISCKGGDKNQKVEWIDPYGNVVQRVSTNRVFVQEHFVPSYRARIPAAVLVLTRAAVEDSGIWECRAGNKKQEISICVLDAAEFVDTPTDVTVDLGRSITLTCQSRGGPEPRLQWSRNGEIITDDVNSSKYAISTKYNSQGFEGLLTVMSLEREDAGVYICEAVQESPHDSECTVTKSINITLNVNYAPFFPDGNETAIVFVKENERMDLSCSADGFPAPTYRWFKEIGDVLSEFPQSDIKSDEDGTKAIVTLKGGEALFGQRFRCRATNQYGSIDKVYALQKLERPVKPSELNINNSSFDSLQINAIWEDEAFYQVAGVEIQYLELRSLGKKKISSPRESDWRKADEVEIASEDFDSTESSLGGAFITLPNLEEDTEYWIRLRATNEAGKSSWSEAILASTNIKIDIEEVSQESLNEDRINHDSEARVYGLLFAGGVLVIAFGSMFVIRVV